MKLPTLAELGLDAEAITEDDSMDEIETLFDQYVDKHSDEISDEIFKKVAIASGNYFGDDEPFDIDEFKSNLLMAFAINEDGIEDPEDFLDFIFN